MGRFGKGRAGDLRRAEPAGGSGVTLVELKVLRYELEERVRELRKAEARHGRTGRWNLRRESKEQRHRKETLLADVERRIKAMEASS